MWYIPHTKTKIIAHVHTARGHTGTRADFFFGMYPLQTRFARIIPTCTLYEGYIVSVHRMVMENRPVDPGSIQGSKDTT